MTGKALSEKEVSHGVCGTTKPARRRHSKAQKGPVGGRRGPSLPRLPTRNTDKQDTVLERVRAAVCWALTARKLLDPLEGRPPAGPLNRVAGMGLEGCPSRMRFVETADLCFPWRLPKKAQAR